MQLMNPPKMTESEAVQIMKLIDFGDIDGLYDPNILDYFIDYEYTDKIINSNIYFVIGRKGTGKSALYNYINKVQGDKGILVSNLSFNHFPFDKFLKLSDDNFASPNQYQSIWRNIILSEFAKQIVEDQSNPVTDIYIELRNYVEFIFGTDLIDLHKKVINTAKKLGSNIGFKIDELGLSQNSEFTLAASYEREIDNIAKINSRLERQIRTYLKINSSNKYIIQFDQLDDNYNLYSDSGKYFQALISLFKSIYDINQTFRSEGINSKIVAYIRSDIFYSINAFDAESARWDQFKMNLNWAIVNKTDWKSPRLKEIINRRIKSSLFQHWRNISISALFDKNRLNLKENGKVQSLFKYMVHRSFHRPRDIIQFCIKIQNEVEISNSFNFRTILNAEKEYSLWLLSELENEISPKIKDVQSLYEVLRICGRKPYSMQFFRSKYQKYQNKVNLEPEELLRFLYSLGIVMNTNPIKGYTEFFSIIRNDRSVFNRDLKILTHPGFYHGLYISKFLKRP